MSGSDASVSRSSGIGGGPDACAITFETTLASPDPVVVDTLRLGEILDVVSIEEPVRGVIAAQIGGPMVGAVTREILGLRRCMESGYQYEAEVVRLEGGSVTIRLQPR